MINFIIKKCVKNYEKTEDGKVREAYGVVISTIGILCNVLLFIIKFLIGFIIGSVAITADSFNNLTDAGSSVISLIGFKMANKPADKEHPFGHGRIEYISAFIISIIILLLGLEFLKSSVEKIFHPEEVTFSAVSIVFLLLTIIIKLWMAYFNRKIGRKINSEAMLATAQDSINDVFITSATIISILITYFTGFAADGYAGVIVAAILLYTGYGIARDVLSRLLGESTPKKIKEEIISLIESYDGIVGAHDLIVHNYGPNKSMASIHAEVSADMSFIGAHKVIDRIEKEVGEKMGIILLIHMDPVDTGDKRIAAVSESVLQYIEENKIPVEAHDFTLVDSDTDVNIIFELIVPHEYSKEEVEEIKEKLQAAIFKVNPLYKCIINEETGFC